MEAYLGVGISLEIDSALAIPAEEEDGLRSDTTVSRASTTARPARKYLKCKEVIGTTENILAFLTDQALPNLCTESHVEFHNEMGSIT